MCSRVCPDLWRNGEKAKVRHHNRTDCRLTAELWIQLVLDRNFWLPSKFDDELAYFPHCEVDAKLWNLLVSRPHPTYAQWQHRLTDWGNALRPRTKVFVREADAGANPRHGCLRCYWCKKTIGLITRRRRQFGKRELGIRPGPGSKYVLPTAVVEFAGEFQLCRLPLELAPWAFDCVALANGLANPFPSEVEFGVLNGRVYAQLLP